MALLHVKYRIPGEDTYRRQKPHYKSSAEQPPPGQCFQKLYHVCCIKRSFTYDHRSVRTGHPVRSAIHKH
jgi:hypothetical protein